MSALAPIPFGTASGREVDLRSLAATDIDFERDVAEHLAKLARFSGGTRGSLYSVAQHCVHGADALKAETGRSDMALAFLLHDVHEYLLGDWTSPAQALLAAVALEHHGETASALLRSTLSACKARLDAVIYPAAGLRWPLPPDIAAAVIAMDARMLATEQAHLRGVAPAAGAPKPVRLPWPWFGALRPWPWPVAADEWRHRFSLYRTPLQTRPSPRSA